MTWLLTVISISIIGIGDIVFDPPIEERVFNEEACLETVETVVRNTVRTYMQDVEIVYKCEPIRES